MPGLVAKITPVSGKGSIWSGVVVTSAVPALSSLVILGADMVISEGTKSFFSVTRAPLQLQQGCIFALVL